MKPNEKYSVNICVQMDPFAIPMSTWSGFQKKLSEAMKLNEIIICNYLCPKGSSAIPLEYYGLSVGFMTNPNSPTRVLRTLRGIHD